MTTAYIIRARDPELAELGVEMHVCERCKVRGTDPDMTSEPLEVGPGDGPLYCEVCGAEVSGADPRDVGE